MSQKQAQRHHPCGGLRGHYPAPSTHRDQARARPAQLAVENFRSNTDAPRSCLFVGSNVSLNFLPMCAVIRPGVGQVLSAQPRVAAQKLGFAGAKLACLYQEPDGHACAHNTRFASAYTRCAVDPRKSVAQITGSPLKNARFLTTGQVFKQRFGLIQNTFHCCDCDILRRADK